MAKRVGLPERFWSKVKIYKNSCWLWTALFGILLRKGKKNYGSNTFNTNNN